MYGSLPYSYRMEKQTPTARLEARLPSDVHTMLKRAAQLQGRTLTDFVVAAASEAARKTIEDMEIIRLSAADQVRVAEAVLNPPDPAPALVRAFERYHKMVENPEKPLPDQ